MVKIDLKTSMVKLEEVGKGVGLKGTSIISMVTSVKRLLEGFRWKGTFSDKFHKASRKGWMKWNMWVGRMG